ncbi:MAG TPA: three-Cys-motif partner protein TcmP [Thermodesulfobacteriota bacterium]
MGPRISPRPRVARPWSERPEGFGAAVLLDQSAFESVVGPWAREKLEHLRKYLDAYTKIMRKKTWCKGFVYVDAFAGPGRHKLRLPPRGEAEQRELIDLDASGEDDAGERAFIAGSPKVALESAYPFSWYVFLEKDPDRVAALRSLAREYGETRNVAIRQVDCGTYLRTRLVDNPKINWREWRAVVFLDPFGMQVTWDTMTALAKTRAIEVFVNFPVGMAIQRLLLRSGQFDSGRRARLDSYFGSPEWFDLLYTREKTLFGESQVVKRRESGHALVRWYRDRLRKEFGYASRAALIRNTAGGHLYYLLLATPNRTGLRIANHVLSAGESV